MNKKEMEERLDLLIEDCCYDLEINLNDLFKELRISKTHKNYIEITDLFIKLMIKELEDYKLIS